MSNEHYQSSSWSSWQREAVWSLNSYFNSAVSQIPTHNSESSYLSLIILLIKKSRSSKTMTWKSQRGLSSADSSWWEFQFLSDSLSRTSQPQQSRHPSSAIKARTHHLDVSYPWFRRVFVCLSSKYHCEQHRFTHFSLRIDSHVWFQTHETNPSQIP